MADLDKAARYQAKQDPPGFFTWLWRHAVTPLRFHSWWDTRRLARPEEEDRTCDMVAAFRLPDNSEPTHVLVIDFKARAQASSLDQVFGYVVRLRTEPPPDVAGPLQVGAAVINLTGPSQTRTVAVDFPGVPECDWHFGILQRTLREESAAATLADIAAGRTTRWILPWVPLMRGGGKAAIIKQWKRVALAEPDPEIRATLGSLTLVFAELAKRLKVWEQGLRGWNMWTSKVVEGWREEGRAEGRAEGRVEGQLESIREALQVLLEERFGRLPKAWVQRIQAVPDVDRLKAALRQAVHIQALKELHL